MLNENQKRILHKSHWMFLLCSLKLALFLGLRTFVACSTKFACMDYFQLNMTNVTDVWYVM